MQVVMEKVDRLPASRGNRGYGAQAERILGELRAVGGPVLVARDDTRNGLETIAKYLKEQGAKTVVAIADKGEDGTPTAYALYAEYTDI